MRLAASICGGRPRSIISELGNRLCDPSVGCSFWVCWSPTRRRVTPRQQRHHSQAIRRAGEPMISFSISTICHNAIPAMTCGTSSAMCYLRWAPDPMSRFLFIAASRDRPTGMPARREPSCDSPCRSSYPPRNRVGLNSKPSRPQFGSPPVIQPRCRAVTANSCGR